MRFRRTIILSLIAAYASISGVLAQQWLVPDDQKGKVAPFLFTPEMKKQGENLYNKNCASCHGIPGKDNWVKQLTPPPGDLAQAKAQSNSDGEMFYKLTVGKAPMPEFRNILSEEERWWVIAYLRSFNSAYVQPDPAAQGSFAGKLIKLQMVVDTAKKGVQVTAMEMTKEKSLSPAKGVEVLLFVKRFFGSMQIGDPKTTNEQGVASFEFPADIPGDKEGKVELTCRVNDASGSISSSPVTATYSIGVPTDKPGLTETRAWWSTRDKAPVWIIVTYLTTVLIVWGIIFYILYSILKIRKLNKK